MALMNVQKEDGVASAMQRLLIESLDGLLRRHITAIDKLPDSIAIQRSISGHFQMRRVELFVTVLVKVVHEPYA